MKKIILCLFTTCSLLLFYSPKANAATVAASTSIVALKPVESEKAKAKVLEFRLNEINAMDKSTMKSSEKKSLRKEVRSIRHQLREIGGGVYISAGGLLLILILLIILL